MRVGVARTSELKDRRIRSNVVSLGPVDTPQATRRPVMQLRASCPRSQLGASASPMKLPRRRCFSGRMTPVSSRVSNYSLKAAERKSNRSA